MNRYISDSAKLGKNVEIGINVVIEDGVEIGDNCLIGHNVVIYSDTVIGDGVRIDANTIIGKRPLSSPRSIFKVADNMNPTRIGKMCQIGANVVIYCQAVIGDNNLIADMATVRENVTVGNLNIIGRNVSIENFVEIGDRNKLETNAYITAYSKVEDYCFVAPCVATSNDNYMARDKERFNHFKGVTIKRGARIGVNVTVLPGKVIGEDSQIAAGALVTKDITPGKLWIGSPAREVKDVAEKQRLENNLDK
ncbi:MAG: DapH/DapD/GlmU-related protein [Candidatus Zophobacter franzmannii]|nr:DapH/DapD/GlmU-related protein [Candidatus Zophobacter franzmannii]